MTTNKPDEHVNTLRAIEHVLDDLLKAAEALRKTVIASKPPVEQWFPMDSIPCIRGIILVGKFDDGATARIRLEESSTGMWWSIEYQPLLFIRSGKYTEGQIVEWRHLTAKDTGQL